MGELIRTHDWSATLGPLAQWPRSLQTAVRMMLSSRHPIWVGWGPQLTYLYNDAYRTIIGGKHPWALGQTVAEVWPEIQDYMAPRLEQVLAGGEGTYVEGQLLIMERNGYPEETYYTFSFSPLPEEDGHPGGIICVNTDDTRRMIGDRQLATLREQAASTINAHGWRDTCERSAAALAANDKDVPFAAIYVAEADGDFVLAASSGVPANHAIAPLRIQAGDERAWPLARALAVRHPLQMHDLAARFGTAPPHGAWPVPPREAMLLPMAPAGEQGRAAVLVVGLSPYRLYDTAYAGFLELAAGQIGAAIAQADTLEAERRRAQELARLDQAKTLFFSNVSHEFRTPLTLMLGPLEEWLARAEATPGESRTLVELAHRNGQRLLKLVNTLLDFARIEAGRAQARFEPTDLSALTTDLASSFRSAIEKAGLTLSVACPAGLPPIYVDREMWEKIVLNLVSNAFKFTFKGGIVVTLSPHDDGLALDVSDTGTGIPAEQLPRLFERFHRVEGARGRSIEGSGIGLALVRELVGLHRGRIEAASIEGRGTTFSVRMPLGKAHLDATRVVESDTALAPAPARYAAAFVDEAAQWLPAGTASAPYVSVPDGASGEYILLADDNHDMCQYVQRLLQDAGWRVECVADGEQALAAISRERPALLLADVMMPRLDGLGLVKAVRSDPLLALLPVLLLSARAGEEAKVEGIEAGADDYLVKPFTARELLVRVQSHVALAGMRRETAERERTLREQAEQAERRLRQRTGQLLDAQRDILQSREALRALNATLEERVANEITERARAEEQLRQAQKMEAIGHLTGGVAHDFNNLLTVIIGNLELVQRHSAPESSERLRRFTDNAMLGARRAATLTQRLLAFARQQPLEPRPVDVNRLVLGMSDLLARTLGESIAIETVLSNDLWQVNADGNQLESALLNLVVNARDAMPRGGRLRIETANLHIDAAAVPEAEDVAPGAYARLSITDTGSGMPPEVRDRVFEPFFTTKPTGHGTGLGLSQVYGFVRQSEGFVTLQSAPDQGTTVRIHLPRLTVEQQVVESGRRAVPEVFGGQTVLVVEDNPDVRDYSCLLLRELGCEVLAAEDAPAALLLLAQHPEVNLLFTDVGLPGMNGRELAEQALGMRPGLKVLFVSGYARQAIVHHGRLDPGVQMLAKPFTHGELAEKLAAVIEVRHTV